MHAERLFSKGDAKPTNSLIRESAKVDPQFSPAIFVNLNLYLVNALSSDPLHDDHEGLFTQPFRLRNVLGVKMIGKSEVNQRRNDVPLYSCAKPLSF